MAFIELHADMTGIRSALERIAAVLERISPEPLVVDEPAELRKTELHRSSPSAVYATQVEQAVSRGEDPTLWEYMPPQYGGEGRG
jgi:hypothetical protein